MKHLRIIGELCLIYADRSAYCESTNTWSRPERILSTQSAIEEQAAKGASTRLVPIAEASRRLRRSVWTLKRLYGDGDLPVTIIRNRWFVPESFIDLVFVSMRPGRAADFSEVAQAWFAANADPAAVA